MSSVERKSKDALRVAQERIAQAAEASERDQSRAPLLEALADGQQGACLQRRVAVALAYLDVALRGARR
jgi:hypothetical protein